MLKCRIFRLYTKYLIFWHLVQPRPSSTIPWFRSRYTLIITVICMCFIIIIPSFNNIFESGINKKLFLKCSLNTGPSPSRKQKRCFYIIERLFSNLQVYFPRPVQEWFPRRPSSGEVVRVWPRHPLVSHCLLHRSGEVQVQTKMKTILLATSLSCKFTDSRYIQAVEQITSKTLSNYEGFLGKQPKDEKAYVC